MKTINKLFNSGGRKLLGLFALLITCVVAAAASEATELVYYIADSARDGQLAAVGTASMASLGLFSIRNLSPEPGEGGSAAELSVKLNTKMSGIETSIEAVKVKAKENGELSSGLKTELESLTAKFNDTEKELKGLGAIQEQIDGLEVKMKQVRSSDETKSKFELEIVQHMEGIKEFQGGKSSKFGFDVKATMLNSVHSGDVQEQARLSGVFHTPDRVQHVRNVMKVSSFATETLRYVQETAYTDNVGERAEGSAIATESDFVLTEQTSTPSIISSFFNVSKESLSDIPYLMGHIQTRGMSKLMLEEDQQVLYGLGTGNELQGITVAGSAYSDSLADANVNRADVLASAVTQATVNEYAPNFIMLHPTDWDLLAREKDADGRYLFPNAFMAGSPMRIHGALVIANTAVTSGDFIVGDWTMGAELAIRSNATIEVSREHSTNFTTGLATVLIEERVALPIYRTNAFIFGDFATALAEGTA